MSTNVKSLPLVLNDANFLERLRAASKSQSPFLTDHAKARMRQRRVSSKQVYECIAKGAIEEPAHLTKFGEWAATIGYFTGGDYIKVAAAISSNDKGEMIIVITVIV
ncbi:MAG: hypothetical protein CTY32_08395 [Methylotenera sp.]|nr:MAG: hypothetical protein CTY32_08395 [Methylotenera sp.]